ncbi:MAG: hypothetical protein ABI910_12415 [Gemmatimonadota bacterium]
MVRRSNRTPLHGAPLRGTELQRSRHGRNWGSGSGRALRWTLRGHGTFELRGVAMRSVLSGTKVLLQVIAMSSLVATSGRAQERNLTLVGIGTIGGGRSAPNEVREARLTLRANADFAVTVVSRKATIIVKGRWQRPTIGNVDRIDVREVAGVAVRGSGTLSFADRDRMVPRALQLSWSDRAGSYRLELATRDGEDDDSPDGWRAGAGSQVYRNVDARAEGDGLTRMEGVRGGAYSVVRARIGTGGDVIVDVDRPTRGEIRGRVRRVQGQRIEIAVTAIFGYTATGTLTVRLRSADEVQSLAGSGSGERGPWSLDFRGTGMPNEIPRPNGGDLPDNTALQMDRAEGGRGTLSQEGGSTLAIGRATVRLDRAREGHIILEARRERVTIDGRWLEAADGRVQFEVRRVNAREASGRLTIRRDGSSFSTIQGDGRALGKPFTLVFATH